jgi:uncharacterized protein (DUF1778 family)
MAKNNVIPARFDDAENALLDKACSLDSRPKSQLIAVGAIKEAKRIIQEKEGEKSGSGFISGNNQQDIAEDNS